MEKNLEEAHKEGLGEFLKKFLEQLLEKPCKELKKSDQIFWGGMLGGILR